MGGAGTATTAPRCALASGEGGQGPRFRRLRASAAHSQPRLCPARRPLRQAAGRHVLGDPSSRKDDAGGLPRPPGEAAGAEGPREVPRRGHHGDLKRIAAQTGTPWNKIVLKKGCSIVKDPVSLADCGIHDGRNLGL